MKNLFLILLLSFSASTIFAQFGIKGGVNASNISSDDENIDDIQSKLGYQLGALVSIPISEVVWISPELIFVRKGAKYQYLDTDVKSDMNYLEIPITISFHPRLLPINFHIGPQFSYLLNTKVTYQNGVLGSVIIEDNDRDNYEEFDLGLALGAGLQINNAFLELRYSHSLKEYEKSAEIENITIQPASKHFNLQLSLGYFF